MAATTSHSLNITPVAECIGSPMTFATDWFIHPSASDAVICSRCYVDYIYESEFASYFQHEYIADGKPRRCFFGSSQQVKEILWPAAKSTKDISGLVRHWKARQAISHCPELNPLNGTTWYMCTEIDGMTVCVACYHDLLMATQCGGKFAPQKLNNPATCEFGYHYTKRMFETLCSNQDWNTFATEMKARVAFPQCPKCEVLTATGRVWFVNKPGKPDLTLCIGCYCDYFIGTPNEQFVEPRDLGASKVSCSMGKLNIEIATKEVVNKKDWNAVWSVIEAINREPACTAEGIKGGTWYTLVSNPPGFALCGGCYAGIVQPIKQTELFKRKYGVNSAETIKCCFNPTHPRAGPLLSRFAEAIFKNNAQELNDYAKKFAGVAPCPRSNQEAGKNREYWGWDDARICEDCYLSFAQGTALEPRFDMCRKFIADTRLCDLYSSRMRNFFTQACHTGNLAIFFNPAMERRRIFFETMPLCEKLLEEQKLLAFQAQMFGIASRQHMAFGGALDSVQGHASTMGNAQLGYGYANPMELRGAGYNSQMYHAAQQASNPDKIKLVGELETRWKLVE